MKAAGIIAAMALAACGGDDGWSRADLPPNARIDLELTGTSADQCRAWADASAFTSATANGLDTDAPTIRVSGPASPCTWSGDAINCTLSGPVGSLLDDFDRAIASQVFNYTDIGGAAKSCLIDYAVTGVVAL